MSADGFLRLVTVGVRRYSRDPETRAHSARVILSGALALFAGETSAGEAALTSAEIIATLAEAERRERREEAMGVAAESGGRA